MKESTPTIVTKTFTLNELISMRDVLQTLFSTHIPIKVSFRLQKFLKLVNAEYETYEKLRLELFKRYGEEKDDQMMIKPEFISDFTVEMNDLLSQEISTTLIPINVNEVKTHMELTTIESAKIAKLFDVSELEGTVEEVVFSPSELVSMRDTMQKLFEIKLPIDVAFSMALHFLNPVNVEFEKFEERRFELFKVYGEENENGQMTVKPENLELFSEKLNALLNETMSLMIQKIKLNDLDGRVELTAIEVSHLEKVLTE